jgi:uncharacterized protein YbaR (Trm112 family)
MEIKELIPILACPACLSPVAESGDWVVCQGKSCGLKFPIQDGKPSMVLSDAQGSPELLAKLRSNPEALRAKK